MMRVKEKLQNILCKILLVIASVVFAIFIMLLVYTIPVSPIVDNVRESSDMLLNEGDYPTFAGRITKGDNFTDSIMIGKAMYKSGDKIKDALLNPSLYVDGESYVQRVIYAIDNPEAYTVNYARYWHGYLVILKPMLYIFNVQQLRLINMSVQYMLVLIACLLICKKRDYKYTIVLFISILIINPISTALSFQYSDIFYITLFTVLILLFKNDYFVDKGKMDYLLIISGICCAFFDFLTYPIVALGLPLCFYLILEENNSRKFKTVIKASFWWCFGYGGMWSSKWIVAYLFTGEDVLADAKEQMIYRSGSVDGDVRFGRFDGIKSNWDLLMTNPVIKALVFIIIIFFVIVLLKLKHNNKKFNLQNMVSYIFVSMLPIAWYILILNHSVHHPPIVYRDFAVSFAAIISMLICINDYSKENVI